MKKFSIVLASIAFCAAAVGVSAQSDKDEVKTGWGWGAMPCATYSTDMGFQYGVFGDFYNYGDGSMYPNYKSKISYEVSHFTKGRTRLYLAYDNKTLIPGVRATVSATYIDDPLYNFYGFNGAAQYLANDLESNKNYGGAVLDGSISLQDKLFYGLMGVDPLAESVSYYYMNRNYLRLLADFQGNITPELRWAGGLGFWSYRMSDMNGDKYGYDVNSTLYRHYKDYGVLKENELNGGNRLEIKAGIVYDSRDNEAAPNKGIWSELYLNGSPDLFGDGFNYLKLSANFRHYITIPVGFIAAGDPVFAYRLAYQGTVAGEAPFYVQQTISALILKQMVSEGLGSSNSIRGTRANRLIGDGYAWGNFELRVKLVDFKLFGQYFYLATNPFFDCGMIVQPYRVEEMSKLPEIADLALKAGYDVKDVAKYVTDQAGKFICTGGVGLKLAWNQNFIISAEVAHNFNQGIGDPFWMSIGTNYNF